MFYANNKYIASFDEYDNLIAKFKKMPDVLYLESDISETAMEELFLQAKKKQETTKTDISKTPIEFLLYMQTKIQDNEILYKDYQYLIKRIDKVINRHLELVDTEEMHSNIIPFAL